MAFYAIDITPLLNIMLSAIADVDEMVVFADDITSVGKLFSLKQWWDKILSIGSQFRYFPQPAKSWLICERRTS